ncbi:hypothetical protein OG935_05165 [Nocardia cyriacigeorgica]|uniref:Rv1733c family protein n=1 Tax=Nocardia cyriacigeorgica TaxID=135487 RepID=UPI00189499D0|nr:hypothetical protein [Nocardia cyriacigeorgica]MBF6095643.1 hypothetical protein [Nocardia cyriacigeorgica]MBF6428467.1 hypothetical protein [Nocardia cyriacigeorgica]
MVDKEGGQTRARVPMWWCGRPWNPNPLLRTSDRAFFSLRAVALAAMLLAVPIALTIGTQVYTDDVARIRSEHAAATSVDATVLTEPEWTEAHDFEAQVRWDRGDRTLTATVPVPRATDVGDRVAVWIDDDGAPTDGPRSPVTAVFAGIGSAVLVMTAACLLGLGFIRVVSTVSDRRHARQWDSEWALFDKPVTGDMS